MIALFQSPKVLQDNQSQALESCDSTLPEDVALNIAKSIEDHGTGNMTHAIRVFVAAGLQKLQEIKDNKPDTDAVRELNFAYIQAQLIPAILAQFQNSEFAYKLVTAAELKLNESLGTEDPSTPVLYTKAMK